MQKINKLNHIIFLVSIVMLGLSALALILNPYTNKVHAVVTSIMSPLIEQTIYESNSDGGLDYFNDGGLLFRETHTVAGSVDYSLNNTQCEISVDSGPWKTTPGTVTYEAPNPYAYFFETSYKIRAVNDTVVESNQSCTFTYETHSTDPEFDGIVKSRTFTIMDNETPKHEFYLKNLPQSVRENGKTYEPDGVIAFDLHTSSEPNGITQVRATSNEWCSSNSSNNGFNSDKADLSYWVTPISSAPKLNAYHYSYDYYPGNDNVYTPNKFCTITFEVVTVEYDSIYSNVKLASISVPIIDDDAPSNNDSTSKIPKNVNATDNKTSAPLADPSILKTIMINGEPQAGEYKVTTVFGNSVTLSGTDTANRELEIILFSDPIIANVTTDDSGYWSHTFTDVPEGEHHVELRDLSGNSEPITIASLNVVALESEQFIETASVSLKPENTTLTPTLTLIGIALIALVAFLIKSKLKPIAYITHLLKH